MTIDVSMTVTEQLFQRMETGKSYSIHARKIDEGQVCPLNFAYPER